MITLAPELNTHASGICLEPSSSGNCTVTGQFTLTVEDLLPSGYTDLSTFIEFILVLKNPKEPIQYATLSISIISMDSTESNIYHMGCINLSNSGYYEPHELTNILIIPESDIAVTKTKYNFTFTNTQYRIPAGSAIQITFPLNVQYIGNNPPIVTDLLNINNNINSDLQYPILTISDGFPSDLVADQDLQFVVDDVLNPYGIMETASFIIIIYINGDLNQKVFENTEGLTINTLFNCAFPGANIVPDTLKTVSAEFYRFTLELGAGALNTSDIIEFISPPEIYRCFKYTLSSTSGILIIGSIYQDPTNTIYFEIGSTIPAYSIFSFSVLCRNPYTTRPSTDFVIVGRGSDHSFYASNVSIPAMNIINNYDSVSVTSSNNFPKNLNTFNFSYIGHNYYTTSAINQIVIYTSGIQIDSNFVVEIERGIYTDGFTVTSDGEIITLGGITSLDEQFRFHIQFLRNPSLADTSILFSTATMHSDGYVGENRTTTLTIPCNFPCRTCDHTVDPDICLTCFSEDHEVFQGGNSFYMLSNGECLDGCPLHTYILGSDCLPCHSSCDLCDGGNVDDCTKCYPNTSRFLYFNQCISPPCPSGYIHNELNWNCISTYIYIYIYI